MNLGEHEERLCKALKGKDGVESSTYWTIVPVPLEDEKEFEELMTKVYEFLIYKWNMKE